MVQQSCQTELIRRAQQGDRQCLEQLAGQVRERLRTYVYRLTQRDDLAQEIVQETLLEMCKVLGKLNNNDRFWPWLYGIAVNKLRRHYRTEQTQKKLAISSAKRNSRLKDRQDGLENLVGEELKQIVSGAMKKLRTRHKAVLIMRCYDGMTHSEIAESLGCSEFSTRMLFLRAKKALQRELSRNGFGKASFLTALVLFGKLTAPSKAAAAQISISASTVKVGLLTGVVGLATTKTAIVTFTAAGALTAGTIVTTSAPWKDAEAPRQSQVNTQVISQFDQNSKAAEEHWYYFPQGASQFMMLRATSGVVGEKSYKLVLQNENANYSFSDNSVHINNYRTWASDFSVLKFPTDDPKLTDFIYQVEGSPRGIKHLPAKGKDLLVVAARNKDNSEPWAIRHSNVLEEGYFQSDWPTTAKVIDNRDVMHKRGWTYFRVTGQINDENISGMGRIPFVYATSAEYSPWMKLRVGSMTIFDSKNEAYVQSSPSQNVTKYQPGSFFKGLAKPWLGLHTIDVVRRDAAAQRVRFETKHTPGSRFAQVELIHEGVRIIYSIDLETDVIDEITFSTDKGDKGNLKFSYIQTINDVINGEFVPPNRSQSRGASKSSSGLLWLVELVEGALE
ncbi:MAG: RNA polymerase sigma factor [Planctomycetes bacterium]|nr:RNA polymerase sigma factor [Planctomycetota bacterium]MBL7143440.1 RNA polymerase sigma factor [Phycisphaerae bacterium]